MSTMRHVPITWRPHAGGRLALGPRPGRAAMAALRGSRATHVVTLISEREGARQLEAQAYQSGLGWAWFPLANGDPPPRARDDDARRFLDDLAALLAGGASLYLHCAAGIHRTGMVAYALLRHLGAPPDAAGAELAALRAVTAEGVRAFRLEWGERLARAPRLDHAA